MRLIMKRILFLISLTFSVYNILLAQINLPQLVSDGMVLQRNATVNLWGWASPGEEITIHFLNDTLYTQTLKDGTWKIQLSPQPAGGPYRMSIQGSNKIVLNDIYMGDVWLCSGQSNMELPMRRVEPQYRDEIKAIDNATIRMFTIPHNYDFNFQHEDLMDGKWLPATQENILNFSAVAYFFAKHVQENQGVPIGLLNASLGGSPVEAWMSEETLKPFEDAYRELQTFKDEAYVQSIKKKDQKRNNQWYGQLAKTDKGRLDSTAWNHPDLDDSKWETTTIPGMWHEEDLTHTNGVVWFRKHFTVPEAMENKPARLELGAIVDADSVFVNGKFVGNTTYKYPPRWYHVPANVLHKGENNITIKVISNIGNGGFVIDKAYELTTATDTVSMEGTWKYKVGTKVEPLQSQTFIRWKPAGLYNGMIHPLINYTIKGAIWYQGESNVGRADDYKKRLSAMIANWRNDWQQGDFPFLIVQLANYLEAKDQPADSEWAELREAQYEVAKTVPNCAMACAIDLGEWNDIHPLRKEEVGERLALAAEKVAYGNTAVVSSGPTLAHWQVKRNKIILTFDNVGDGLQTSDGKAPVGFAIAGEDGTFAWAQAIIKKGKVWIWNDTISSPTAVRYGWADNPDKIHLYNSKGLPAVPFEAVE